MVLNASDMTYEEFKVVVERSTDKSVKVRRRGDKVYAVIDTDEEGKQSFKESKSGVLGMDNPVEDDIGFIGNW